MSDSKKTESEDEFFIGWQGKSPPKTGRYLKTIVLVCGLAGLALGVAVPALQQTVPKDAAWDFKNREFTGILVKEPAPVLVGDDGEVRFLVNPFKYGFDPEVAAAHHLQRVTLMGSLITRDDQSMIQALPETVKPAGESDGSHPLGAIKELGEVTLRGEIVDSKCYLGVMTPGNLKPHRACAINCIAGGIPPVLVVRDEQGRATYYLLVGPEGEAINEDVLPLVAEPVEVTGALKHLGSLQVIYANPAKLKIIGG